MDAVINVLNITREKIMPAYKNISKCFSSEIKDALRAVPIYKNLSNQQNKLLKNADGDFYKKMNTNLVVPNANAFDFLIKSKTGQQLINQLLINIFKRFNIEITVDDSSLKVDDIINKVLSKHDIGSNSKKIVLNLLGLNLDDLISKLSKDDELISSLKNNSITLVEHNNALNEKKEENKSLKKEISELQRINEKLSNEKKSAEEDFKKSENEKNELLKSNDDFQTKLKEAKEKISTLENEPLHSSSDSKEFEIQANEIGSDLCKEVFIGTCSFSDIVRVQNGWELRIRSFIENIPLASYLPIDDFSNYANYRFGGFQKYFLSINEDDDILFRITNDDSYLDFKYKNIDDQKNILFNLFCKKIIVFTITNKILKGKHNYSINNVINLYEFNDFNKAVTIPLIKNMAESTLKKKIEQNIPFEIEGFPVTTHSSIKYVILSNNIYHVNLVPNLDDFGENRNKWVSMKNTKLINLGKQKLESNDDVIYVEEKPVLFATNDYLARLESQSKVIKELSLSEDDFLKRINNYALKKKLYYSYDDIKNFHIAIKTSNIVILAGPSGVGKSRLPQLYAEALELNEDKGDLLFVTVNPSYTEPSDLLGFVKPYLYQKKIDEKNKLESETKTNDEEPSKSEILYDGIFEEAANGLVSFIQEANKKPEALHIVIFDEMNLSQIEYWFAPFMSILERNPEDRNLQLYSPNMKIENSEKYPSSIHIGSNIIFIGTINLDETTKDISDRLLDRSIVINLHKNSFKDYLNSAVEETTFVDDKKLTASASLFNTYKKQSSDYIKQLDVKEVEFFDDLHACISNSLPDKGISFRNIKMITNYIANAEGLFDRKIAFDIALKQTVIKKINGNENELSDLLDKQSDNSIYSLLDKYSKLCDFNETKAELDKKKKGLIIYGFTR